MQHTPAPLGWLFLALTLPANAADHWVGPLGSGAPYQDVQAAIDAAAPGDRVLMLPGTYGAVRIDKPLSLTGAGSGTTRILASAGSVPLVIAGLGSGGRFRLSGFEIGLSPGVDAAPPAFLELTDIAGRFEACDLKITRLEHDAHPTGGAYVSIEDCAQVQFSALRVYTQAGPGGSDADQLPLSALWARSSRVFVSDARLEASDLCTDFAGDKPGAPAIRLDNSELHLALCASAGGPAQGGSPEFSAGPALLANASQVVLYGGKSNELLGGSASALDPLGATLAAPAVRLSGASTLTYGSDVVFTPGSGPGGLPALPLKADPPALVQARADRLPSMWIPTPIGAIGEFSGVFLEGDPGAIQFWWLVLETAPALSLPGIFGLFVLDLGLVVHHPPVILGIDGQGSDLAATPPNPNLQGHMLAYQSLEYDGSAELQLAPPWFISFEIF